MTWNSEQFKGRWEELDNFYKEELLINKDKMNTTQNVALNVIGTGLIATGVVSIPKDLLTGIIEIVLGIAIYAVYEYFPTKTS